MTMATEIEGQKISQLAEKTQLDGQEQIPVAHGGQNYRVGADKLKEYVQPDLSGYAEKTGAEFTGAVGTTQMTITRPNQGAMAAILASSNDIQFRTMNAGVDSMTFNVQYSTPLKITETGILENGTLLSQKYALLTDLDDLATKTELNKKVGGTGVTAIQVVSSLPDQQEDGVLYIVTGEEA